MSTRIGAIYGRVSVLDPENEIEHGSLEQQQHLGFDQAKMLSRQSGLQHTIKHVLIEEKAVSGGTTNRPKYQELLNLIAARKIDFVIAKEISRISRSTADFCQFMQLCRANNVAVHIRGLDVDPNTPYGSAMFQILSVIAEFEREINRERTKSSLRSAAINNGKINGGTVVLGFDRIPERLGFWQRNEAEIKHVIWLMEKFCQTMSYKETMDAALAEGIKNKNGNDFSFNSLKCLLTNSKYIGEMNVGDDDDFTIVQLPHGSVVPRELFNQVQKVVAAIEEKFGGINRNNQRIYLLTGLLKSSDGSSYRGHTGTGRDARTRYYYHNPASKNTISADDLEQRVLEVLGQQSAGEELESVVGEIRQQHEHQLTENNNNISDLKKVELDLNQQ